MNEAERQMCNCGKWPHEDFCWMKIVAARASESSPHDWECIAIGEKGGYHWKCLGCGRSLPYPSAQNEFIGNCSNILRAAATAPSTQDWLDKHRHEFVVGSYRVGNAYRAHYDLPGLLDAYRRACAAVPSVPTATDWMRQAAEDIFGLWAEQGRGVPEWGVVSIERIIAKYAGVHAGAESKKEPTV